jgi:hypothetical protein
MCSRYTAVSGAFRSIKKVPAVPKRVLIHTTTIWKQYERILGIRKYSRTYFTTIDHQPLPTNMATTPTIGIRTMVTDAGECLVHKQRLAAVHEHERLFTNIQPFSVRMLCGGTIEDTEPCFSGSSRLHRFACGHIVHTHEPAVCGCTCDTPITNFAPFLCTLCARWSMVQKCLVPKRSSQITDLILPDFPELDQSHIPGHATRALEPCSLQSSQR